MPARPLSRWSLPLVLLAAAFPSPRPAAAQSAPVSAWPLRIDTSAGQLSIYQPQPETFEGDQLSARAAVSLLPTGATDPEFGATWFKARVFTDRDARTVTIQDLDVRQVKLPNSSADQQAGFAAVLKQQLPQMNVNFSLDQLEASLGVVQKARSESQQLDNSPPKIVFTQVPTTLVVLDGPPKLQPADDVPGVLRVVNTPFILLLDGGSKQYYLKAGNTWLAAPDVTGPWGRVAGIPAPVAAEGAKLSVQNQAAPDQQPAAAAAPANAGSTQIMLAEEPTELVSSDGPPQYSPLPGNDLLYMVNTQADVFLEVQTQRTFVLLSGRWFTAPSTNGPWQFVSSDALPPSFAQIPPDSAKGGVLVSVAGTARALDARTDAYIPQTTAIHRDAGTALTVSYDGAPQFVPVQGTPITYASNCADPVLYVDNSYYCCHQAVWYQSAVATGGPWAVCTVVPQVIYTIPPSCPVYNCRYVYVYDSTPDVVYCGYLPGYTGCYVYGPTVVYGTGYAYPYWYHTEFIPRPFTWGFAPRYDYYSSTWGFGVGRPYGPTWFAGGPRDDRHDWFGPQGYVDYHEIHSRTVINNYYGDRGNDRGGDDRRGPAVVNNVRNVTVNRINIYNRQENQTRNVFVNRTNNVTNVRNDTHETVRNDARNDARNDTRTPTRNDLGTVRGNNDGGGGGPAPRPAARPADDRGGNDVYAGRDGQVYRRTDQGWQQRDTRGWSTVAGVPDARSTPADAGSESARHNSRADSVPPHQTPSPDGRDRTPDRTPGRDRPAAPSDSPARSAPARAAAPAADDGLEADHTARERGSSRREAPDSTPRSGDAAASDRPRGGETPARNDNRGNNGGGNNGDNGNRGGGKPGNR